MPAPLTLEQAHTIIRQAGAEPAFDQFQGSPKSHAFICECGTSGSAIFATVNKKLNKDPNYRLRCTDCNRVGNPKYSIEAVQQLFEERGATPLFDTYTRYDKPLAYKCACGNEREVTLESVIERIRRNPEHIIRCQPCAHEGFRPLSTPPVADIQARLDALMLEHEATALEPYPGRNNRPIRFRCKCGNEHSMTWSGLDTHDSPPRCPKCHLEARPRGSDHPSWNPNLTDDDRLLNKYGRGAAWQRWRSAILRRDNYTCQITGQVGGKIAAHHLHNWAHFPDLRFELSNGVTITRELHTLFHERYGKGPNTPEQFREFTLAY